MANARRGVTKKSTPVKLLRDSATRRNRIDNYCESGVSALVRPIVLAYLKKKGVLEFPFCENDEKFGIFVAYGVAELVFKSMERMVEAWISPWKAAKSLRNYRLDLIKYLRELYSNKDGLETSIKNKAKIKKSKLTALKFHLEVLSNKIKAVESKIDYLEKVERRSKCFTLIEGLKAGDVNYMLKSGFRENYEGLTCVNMHRLFTDFPDYATDYVNFLVNKFNSLGPHRLAVRIYANDIRNQLSNSTKHMHEIYRDVMLKCAAHFNIYVGTKRNEKEEMASALKMALREDKMILVGEYRPEQLYSGPESPVIMATQIYTVKD